MGFLHESTFFEPNAQKGFADLKLLTQVHHSNYSSPQADDNSQPPPESQRGHHDAVAAETA